MLRRNFFKSLCSMPVALAIPGKNSEDKIITNAPKVEFQPNVNRKAVTVRLNENGTGQLIVDGVDISRRVKGISVNSYVGEPVSVIVELSPAVVNMELRPNSITYLDTTNLESAFRTYERRP